jgi:hypothetical protein
MASAGYTATPQSSNERSQASQGQAKVVKQIQDKQPSKKRNGKVGVPLEFLSWATRCLVGGSLWTLVTSVKQEIQKTCQQKHKQKAKTQYE